MWKMPQVANRSVRNRLDRPPSLEPLEDRLCLSQYLLVSDYKTNGQVLRYDGTDGHFIDSFIPPGTGGLHNTEYVFLDPSGENILLDGKDTQNILRYSVADGSPNPAPGQSGATFIAPGLGGLATPEGLAFGPDGSVFVSSATATDGDVIHYDGDTGHYLGIFLDGGTNGLAKANDLHFGPDGFLYVSQYAGSSYDNGQLLRFDPETGSPAPAPGRDGANFIDPLDRLANGFTWGPDGNLYVAADPVSNNGSILRFDGGTGDPLPAEGQTGATFVPAGSGGIGFVDGITFGDDGALYITDSQHGAIQKYDGETGDYLGAFVPNGSGGLQNPGGLLFYDEPGTAVAHHAPAHPRQASVALATAPSLGTSSTLPLDASPLAADSHSLPGASSSQVAEASAPAGATVRDAVFASHGSGNPSSETAGALSNTNLDLTALSPLGGV